MPHVPEFGVISVTCVIGSLPLSNGEIVFNTAATEVMSNIVQLRLSLDGYIKDILAAPIMIDIHSVRDHY